MKTLKLTTVKNWFVLSLTIILLGTASCNQAQEKTADETSEEVKVEAPKATIHEATFFGNAEAVKKHIAAKTDLNEKDAYGSTPLHIAATFGKTDVALLLIEGGANVNATSADGSTPLHTAAFYGRTEIVKALLKKGVDASVRNSYNSTAYESVSGPFESVKPIYDQLSKDLGPLGLKLDYEQLQANRPLIAEMIQANGK
ncbi:ankyrin repeat domain-containing protein [Fulvivirga lutimaris]|uniref:ankyrin repeat domain-containing protein n=1 Tax=Fulvivirga lutimaris TaxID=1819566 RepID=UPI0012BCFECC|nr:ankyrin repeat domain-containing protein [Fulvivirga lutimaris]MTI41814.1 ankyrin repeat domain-containing protein [Fulvivirga lutimaris]